MKVLVAGPWLFPRGGGLERYAHTMALHLARQGHEPVCIGHADAPFEETVEGVRRIGVKPGLRLSNTPLGLSLYRRARALLRREAFEVVDVHTPVPGTAEMVAFAARRAGVPHVVTYHAGVLGAPAGLLSLAARMHAATFEGRMLRAASGRIAVSPYVAEHVFRGQACAIIPPGVDADRFSPSGAPVPGRILFVGPVSRAYAWKGFPVLFEAFARLAPFLPEAHLRVVGGGDLVAHYQAKAHALDLAPRVSFAERVTDGELVAEYNRASVVALPSTTPAESFGMALAEANACGRPVVGSDVGGIPFFVQDGVNGLLAPPGDAPALARALLRVLEERDLAARLGQAGRQKVLDAHRWEDLARRTAQELQTAALQRAYADAARHPAAARKAS